jgi:hypothetical protein
MFQKADIARHQRRSNESKHLPEGKIPGHDRKNGTKGLIPDEAVLGTSFDHFVRQKALGIFGIVLAARRTLRRFSDSRTESLAHFKGHQPPTFLFFFFEDLCDA